MTLLGWRPFLKMFQLKSVVTPLLLRLKYFYSKMRPRKKKAEAINGQYIAPNREGHKLVVMRMLLWSDMTYNA